MTVRERKHCEMIGGHISAKEIGEEAPRLLAAFLAHERDGGAFVNTMLAVQGPSSAIGRAAMRFSLVVPLLETDLRSAGEHTGLWSYQPPARDGIEPSPAAARMKACAVTRHGKRKATMTSEALAACRDYVAEKIDLLRRAEVLFASAAARTPRRTPQWWAQQVQKERLTAEKVLVLLPSADDAVGGLPAQTR